MVEESRGSWLAMSRTVVKMDDFATAGEERGDAREIARVDICLHPRLDAGEAAGIETLRFGGGDLCQWRVGRGHRGIVSRATGEEIALGEGETSCGSSGDGNRAGQPASRSDRRPLVEWPRRRRGARYSPFLSIHPHLSTKPAPAIQ